MLRCPIPHTAPAHLIEDDGVILEAFTECNQATMGTRVSATTLRARIGHALRRAEDLPSDVAAAIEAEAGAC